MTLKFKSESEAAAFFARIGKPDLLPQAPAAAKRESYAQITEPYHLAEPERIISRSKPVIVIEKRDGSRERLEPGKLIADHCFEACARLVKTGDARRVTLVRTRGTRAGRERVVRCVEAR